MINAKYYGWRVAHYIALVMFISIVITALSLHFLFGLLDIIPKSGKQVSDVAQFGFDHTFFMNIFFVMVAGTLVILHRRHQRSEKSTADHDMDMNGSITPKRVIAFLALALLLGGLIIYFVTGGS